MGSPDIKLEKIHRQAESNPIINLSMRIRETGKIPNIESSKYVKILGRSECSNVLSRTFKKNIKPEDVLNNAVLCYTNSTRNRLNSVIRKMIFGHESKHPVTNDVVICLRNSSNRKTPIYNGYRGFLLESAMEVENHYYDFKVRFPFEDFETKSKRICKHQFGFPKTFKAFSELEPFGMYVMHWSEVGLLFDYGYALTVHKMQGSQADNVILYNEKPAPVNDDTYRRWLYTATTRSSEYLTILK
jgi:exodeoxyribonuclease-5